MSTIAPGSLVTTTQTANSAASSSATSASIVNSETDVLAPTSTMVGSVAVDNASKTASNSARAARPPVRSMASRSARIWKKLTRPSSSRRRWLASISMTGAPSTASASARTIVLLPTPPFSWQPMRIRDILLIVLRHPLNALKSETPDFVFALRRPIVDRSRFCPKVG